MTRLGSRCRRAACASVALLVLAGCGAASGQAVEPGSRGGPAGASAARAGTPPPARQGHPAPSQLIRFAPASLVLPGGAHAAVEPVQTVDGVLKVPENVEQVGWWDGSAYAGDPFGSTVIAGHVDSATQGIGFFARLLSVKVGDKLTVRGDTHAASYRVISVQLVLKRALATDSEAFNQTGPHRLVLITCAGAYHRDQGGYASNLVVVAKPVGPAH